MALKLSDLSPEAQQKVMEANPDIADPAVRAGGSSQPTSGDLVIVRMFLAWVVLVSIPVAVVLVGAGVMMGWRGALLLLCAFFLIRRW